MFQTCSTNFTHIFGVLNCLFFNNFFLSIFKANVVQMKNAVNNKLRRTIFFILIKKILFQVSKFLSVVLLLKLWYLTRVIFPGINKKKNSFSLTISCWLLMLRSWREKIKWKNKKMVKKVGKPFYCH